MHSKIFLAAGSFRTNRIRVTEEDPIEDGIKKGDNLSRLRQERRVIQLTGWRIETDIYTYVQSGCASHS